VQQWSGGALPLGNGGHGHGAHGSKAEEGEGIYKRKDEWGAFSGFAKLEREQQGHVSGDEAWSQAWPTRLGHVVSSETIFRTIGGQPSDRRGSQFWAIFGLNLDMGQEAKLEPTRYPKSLIKEQ
jgi:hypothetical protein